MSALEDTYAAFVDDRLLAAGALEQVLTQAKRWLASNKAGRLLFFSEKTGDQIDFDLRGSIGEVLERTQQLQRDRRKLVSERREVSLLPRHWTWLDRRPGGASAALRALIEMEMDDASALDAGRKARDAANGLMLALAGDRPGFEEAARALYRGDLRKFRTRIATWPLDIREYVLRVSHPWFALRG